MLTIFSSSDYLRSMIYCDLFTTTAAIGVFVFNANLTYLYSIDIEEFENFQQKIKLPPMEFQLTAATITGLEF